MKILALDIGAGTEDVLIYDDAKESVENCLKMVLPSPSQVYAAQVRSATRICQDLFINGDIIGGGVLSSALKKAYRGWASRYDDRARGVYREKRPRRGYRFGDYNNL